MASLRDARRLAKSIYVKALRSAQPSAFATAMRIRRFVNDGEVQAVAPFDSRILFQHMPIRGRDDFLFHRDHDAIDQLSGAIVLHPRQIRVWIDALEARLEWCDRHRAAMRVLIIPEKHVVYEDKLPLFTVVSRLRPAKQILAALSDPLMSRTLYPVQELKAAGRIEPTYFKTDTHWNAHGALVAYRALIDSLRNERPLDAIPEEALSWKRRPFVGDLGVRFSRERGETRAALIPSVSYKLTFQNNNFGRGAVHVYENARRDLPTCVLFRDSFSNYLIPYLMHGFSSLVAVSSLSCHYDLLEHLKPDVVLFVAIERFLATFGQGMNIELPRDLARVPFKDFSGTALDLISPHQKVFHATWEALAAERFPPLVFGDVAAC